MKKGWPSGARDLTVLALIAALSIATKPYTHSVFAIVTQPFGIPVGVAAGGLYMFWVVLAGYVVNRTGAVFLLCLLQGLLAIALGFTGPLGALVIVSYVLPGLAIEALYLALGLVWADCRTIAVGSALAGALGNIVGALANAVLMFRLKGGILVVISPPSALSGAIGGFLAFAAGRYLLKVLGKEALMSRARANSHTPGGAR